MRSRLRITRGGQVTVPARVRKRWRAAAVIAEDQGDRLVLTPAAEDPVASVAGVFAEETADRPPTVEIMRTEREAEAATEEHGPPR